MYIVIILQKLRWDNCFSYGTNNEIDLANSTLSQLVGTNGVGKSSVPLILEEVMFNKNSKNVKKADIANRYVNKGYDISLDFSVDEDQYNITVARRATLKCKLTRNGEDISSHTASNTYNTLFNILGIDFKTFSQLVYQNTNASLQFLTATDTNRKKFLIDLLKLDDYVAHFETFKDAVRLVSQEITILNAKTDTIVKWLTDNKLDSMTLLSKVDLPKVEEKDEKQLRSLQLEFENISEKNRRINDNNNLLDRLESINIEYAKNMLEEYPEMKPTQDLVSGLGGLDSQKERELDMSEKYLTLRDADNQECPTCEQQIDVDFIDNQYKKHINNADDIQSDISLFHRKLEDIENENKIHRQAARDIGEWENLFRSIDSGLPTRVLDKQKVESQIRN